MATPKLKSLFLFIVVLIHLFQFFSFTFLIDFSNESEVKIIGHYWLISDVVVSSFSTITFYMIGFFILSITRPGRYFMIAYFCEYESNHSSWLIRKFPILKSEAFTKENTEEINAKSFSVLPSITINTIPHIDYQQYIFPHDIPDYCLLDVTIPFLLSVLNLVLSFPAKSGLYRKSPVIFI